MQVDGGCRVGAGFGGVHFDEEVARLDFCTIGDVDGGDLALVEGLDGLGAAGDLDLAGSDGDDVEVAEDRP